MARLNSKDHSFRLKYALIVLAVLVPLAAFAAINTFDQIRGNKLNIDNVQVDGNTVSTTNTNGDLTFDMNGTGRPLFADLTASTVPYLDSNKKLQSSAATDTQLGYLANATGNLCGIAQSCTLTNKSIDGDDNTVTDLSNSAIKAGAAIAVNKLAALTASRALVSDGSGFLSAATTTSTEIGYVSGVTSAIQTQLDAKIAKSTATTKGDLLVATGSATIVRKGIGTDGYILTADSAQTDGMSWAAPAAAPVFVAPTVRSFTSGSGTYNKMYAFVISSGSATSGATYTNNSVTFTVYATVSSGTLVYMSGSGAPSSSGTLTKASGTGDSTLTFSSNLAPVYLRVRMVGGGGGGGGGGTGGAAGSAGGNTTFGTTLLVANGGSGGGAGNGATNAGSGGSGGTASLGTGPIGTAVTGSSGVGGGYVGASSSVGPIGGPGGASLFGGNGAASPGGNNVGSSANGNSGSGGQGGGTNPSSGVSTGGGGGAGGFVDAIIASPSSTYSYAVGALGSFGGAGTNGANGGNGAAGYIEVTEYYR